MSDSRPLFDDPKGLLLDLARQRSLDELLTAVVAGLTRSDQVALARLWMLRPGDICEVCRFREECPDRSACLHLAASAGKPRVGESADWSALDGRFRRFPMGMRKVGLIASTGEPIVVPDLRTDPRWIVDQGWARAEGIVGFGGQPLVHRGETLGVLAVFSRATLGVACLDWLRMIADHVAVAIVNARAFDEIAQLKRKLEQENAYLREEVREASAFGSVVGKSPALAATMRQVDLVARTDASVLILGESGTGKELIARELHQRSRRADRPLIKVNCAAIPRELYESEFFGHARGAFTGALRDRAGRFELADGGTLFLDEVGEIPLELQSKLLRVLQEGELERVGEERTRKVDVRLVAATNRDLKSEAEAGRFRADLYYRLNVFPISLAPLRDRVQDIPLLTEYFLEAAARRMGRPTPRVAEADLRQLERYPWPGNIRELQHVIERALITSSGGQLSFELAPLPSEKLAPAPTSAAIPELMTDAEIRQLEAQNIRAALRKAGGKVYGPEGAAALLQLRPTTLASRMKALGLDRRGGQTGSPEG